MYNHEITLIDFEIVEDSIGNQIKKPIENTILCRQHSVGSREFYQASTVGLRPELKLVVHNFEYKGESLVRFEGIEYMVIRTFDGGTVQTLDSDEVELTCQRRVSNAD